MTILIIDDNEEVRMVLRELLTHRGHTVIVADNGRKAIDLLMVYKVGCIITDIVMPDIEGVELILRLRQSKIPIISISGLSREMIVAEFMASLGVIGFLQKPFRSGDILQLVSTVEEGVPQ